MTGVEVGNIFDLGSRFSEAFNLAVTDEKGERKHLIMGCYGIGTTRLLGTIVEACNDAKGMKWPKTVAPYPVHLVSLSAKDPAEQEKVAATASALHDELTKAGFEPLWDERGASAGEKFADADLIGLPLRLVVSSKSLAQGSVEWKPRHEDEAKLVPLAEIVEHVTTFMNEPYETTSH